MIPCTCSYEDSEEMTDHAPLCRVRILRRLGELRALKRWAPRGWWTNPELERELLRLEVAAGVPWCDA